MAWCNVCSGNLWLISRFAHLIFVVPNPEGISRSGRRLHPKKAGALDVQGGRGTLIVSFAEFKLRRKAETVPMDARRQAVCSVIYQNVYVVTPIDVSGF